MRVKVIEASNTGMKMKLGGRHLSFLSLSVSDGRGNLRPKLFLSRSHCQNGIEMHHRLNQTFECSGANPSLQPISGGVTRTF